MTRLILAALAALAAQAALAQTPAPAGRLDNTTTLGVRRGMATVTIAATRIATLRAGDVAVTFRGTRCPSAHPALMLVTRPWNEVTACGDLGVTVARGDSMFIVLLTPGETAPRQRTVPRPGGTDIVAEAGDAALDVQLLAAQFVQAAGQPNDELAAGAANQWVTDQLFANALAAGDSLLDSAFVAAANWPTLAQARALALRERFIVPHATPSAAAVDSAYAAPHMRYVYHLLVAVDDSASAATRAARRTAAADYLAQLRAGTGFSELAARVSDDEVSRPLGGRIGMVTRGLTVAAFETAAFALAPGAYSEPVETQFGYHILWRPALAAVRDSFTAAVRERMLQRLDSLFLDSLDRRVALVPSDSAPAWMRRIAQSPLEAARSERVLGTYAGGRFLERDFSRWIIAYDPMIWPQAVLAADSVLLEFLGALARNEMVLHAADTLRLALDTAVWPNIVQGHRLLLDTLRAGMRVTGTEQAVVTVARRLLTAAATGPGASIPFRYAWALRLSRPWRLHRERLARVAALVRSLGS
jgi:hypothetical protein